MELELELELNMVRDVLKSNSGAGSRPGSVTPLPTTPSGTDSNSPVVVTSSSSLSFSISVTRTESIVSQLRHYSPPICIFLSGRRQVANTAPAGYGHRHRHRHNGFDRCLLPSDWTFLARQSRSFLWDKTGGLISGEHCLLKKMYRRNHQRALNARKPTVLCPRRHSALIVSCHRSCPCPRVRPSANRVDTSLSPSPSLSLSLRPPTFRRIGTRHAYFRAAQMPPPRGIQQFAVVKLNLQIRKPSWSHPDSCGGGTVSDSISLSGFVMVFRSDART